MTWSDSHDIISKSTCSSGDQSLHSALPSVSMGLFTIVNTPSGRLRFQVVPLHVYLFKVLYDDPLRGYLNLCNLFWQTIKA